MICQPCHVNGDPQTSCLLLPNIAVSKCLCEKKIRFHQKATKTTALLRTTLEFSHKGNTMAINVMQIESVQSELHSGAGLLLVDSALLWIYAAPQELMKTK